MQSKDHCDLLAMGEMLPVDKQDTENVRRVSSMNES